MYAPVLDGPPPPPSIWVYTLVLPIPPWVQISNSPCGLMDRGLALPHPLVDLWIVAHFL